MTEYVTLEDATERTGLTALDQAEAEEYDSDDRLCPACPHVEHQRNNTPAACPVEGCTCGTEAEEEIQ